MGGQRRLPRPPQQGAQGLAAHAVGAAPRPARPLAARHRDRGHRPRPGARGALERPDRRRPRLLRSPSTAWWSRRRCAASIRGVEPKRWRLAALLHDAPEYVVGDMISPFKAALGHRLQDLRGPAGGRHPPRASACRQDARAEIKVLISAAPTGPSAFSRGGAARRLHPCQEALGLLRPGRPSGVRRSWSRSPRAPRPQEPPIWNGSIELAGRGRPPAMSGTPVAIGLSAVVVAVPGGRGAGPDRPSARPARR